MNNYYRAIDANFNRAREGIRVLEDLCRFVLGDAGLAARFRAARHELSLQAARFFSGRLVAFRAVETDGGREFPGTARRNASDLVAANCARVGEAVRTMEELAAIFEPGAAEAFRRVRFTVYGLEKDLAARFRSTLPPRALYAVVDPALLPGDPAGFARDLFRAGARVLQLRPGALSDRRLIAAARALSDEALRRRALFLVGDRVDVALLCGADGVHLERPGGMPAFEARRLLPGGIVGVRAPGPAGGGFEGADFVSFDRRAAGCPPVPRIAMTLNPARGAVVFGVMPGGEAGALLEAGACLGVVFRSRRR